MKTLALAVFLTVSTSLVLGLKFYRRVYGLVDPTILDAIPFLTIVNYDQLEALLDATGEHHLRLNMGEQEFRKAQQKRMKVMLRLVGQMHENARALMAVGQHDRRRGLAAGEPQWRELGQELINASLNVQGGVLAIRLALHKRIIKSAIFPFARTANLAALRSFEGFDLFGAYQRMVDAALELAGAYGDDLREKVANAL